MDIKTIDGTIDYITLIMQRKLSGEEILMIGVAFQNGILRGLQDAENEKEKNINENL